MEYVRTLYREILGVKLAIDHIMDISKFKFNIKKSLIVRFAGMLRRFGINKHITFDIYWYENNIGYLKNCEEFVRYKPINKWLKKECKLIID